METKNPDAASLPDGTLDRKLTGAWQRERSFVHARGACRLVPWLVGLFLATLLVDWAFDLPGILRLVLLAGNVGVFGWLAYRHWLSNLFRYDPARVSLQVEKIHPNLTSLLISYVQFGDKAKPPHGSPWMVQATRRYAEEVAGRLDFSGIVDFKKLKKRAAIAGAVLAVFLLSCFVLGDFYWTLVGRMLMPFSALAYPTRTHIDEVSGPLAVKQGDPADLLAKASRVVPDEGLVYLKSETGRWENFAISRGDESKFGFRVPKANQSFEYYFRIGDARSAKKAVKVVPAPRIVGSSVDLSFPKYVGRTAQQTNLAELREVPEGTAIKWEIRCDQPIRKGKIVFVGDEPRELPLVPDGSDPHVVRFEVSDVESVAPPAADRLGTANATYHFEWTENEHGFTFADATRYSLQVVPDRPPVITVYRPTPKGESDKALATKHLIQDFQYSVADDYGPGEARIAFRVNDGPETVVKLGKIPKLGPRDVVDAKWAISKYHEKLKEGDVVTFNLEATDNRDTKAGPNVARSPTYRVHIVDDKEYAAYIERQTAQGFARTTGTARDVLQSQRNLKGIFPQQYELAPAPQKAP